MKISDLSGRKLDELKKAIKLAQTYATKRVIADETPLRQLITESMAGYDKKIKVDSKREEIIRILGIKTERIYPHGKNNLGLYYRITGGDGTHLDDTIAQVMATEALAQPSNGIPMKSSMAYVPARSSFDDADDLIRAIGEMSAEDLQKALDGNLVGNFAAHCNQKLDFAENDALLVEKLKRFSAGEIAKLTGEVFSKGYVGDDLGVLIDVINQTFPETPLRMFDANDPDKSEPDSVSILKHWCDDAFGKEKKIMREGKPSPRFGVRGLHIINLGGGSTPLLMKLYGENDNVIATLTEEMGECIDAGYVDFFLGPNCRPAMHKKYLVEKMADGRTGVLHDSPGELAKDFPAWVAFLDKWISKFEKPQDQLFEADALEAGWYVISGYYNHIYSGPYADEASAQKVIGADAEQSGGVTYQHVGSVEYDHADDIKNAHPKPR